MRLESHKTTTPALLWSLWIRLSWRHWRYAPGQAILLLAILSLGVAVYISVRLANRAAVDSFGRFATTVTGASDLIITPTAGPIPTSVLWEIRNALAPEPVRLTPILEATAVERRQEADPVVGRPAYRIVGIDLVATANALPRQRSPRASSDVRYNLQNLEAKRQIWISPLLAQSRGLRAGDEFPLILSDTIVPLTIAGIIPWHPGSPASPANTLVMDLPALQALCDRPDSVDRVEVTLPEGPRERQRLVAVRAKLEDLARGRWEVRTPESRRSTGETMTAAFRLNLTVLSLIALLVGLILVMQAMDGAVVRRREEIATLRALGLEPRTIQFAWLIEASSIGLLAGLIGTCIGWAGAQATVRMVARTINSLYFENSVVAATLQPRELLGGVSIGVLSSVIAGWIPARAAALIPPAQLLTRGHIASGLAFLRLKSPAIALLLLGSVLAFLPPYSPVPGVRLPLAGFASAFCGILAAGLLGGSLIRPGALLTRWPARRFSTARIAASHLGHPTGRARLAVAGLVVAVGMSAGMVTMVASFEKTVRGWIDSNLRADLFVASDAAQNASSTSRIPSATWHELAADSDVAGVEMFQGTQIRIDGVATFLGAFGSLGQVPEGASTWITPPDVPTDPAQWAPDVAFASESFTERFGVGPGDTVFVPTPSGQKRLRIAGVFADYGNDRGSIRIARSQFATWFQTDDLINLAAFVRPGADIESVRSRWLQRYPGLRVLTNSGLRVEILRIFQQTFSITYALEFIGVFVAVAGLALALASMLLDRHQELMTLRALGFTNSEIAVAAAWEGTIIGAVGSIVGLALCSGLGYLLIHVINKQSFGWTLQLSTPLPQLATLGLGVVATGTVVSWAVGRWSATLPSDREE